MIGDCGRRRCPSPLRVEASFRRLEHRSNRGRQIYSYGGPAQGVKECVFFSPHGLAAQSMRRFFFFFFLVCRGWMARSQAGTPRRRSLTRAPPSAPAGCRDRREKGICAQSQQRIKPQSKIIQLALSRIEQRIQTRTAGRRGPDQREEGSSIMISEGHQYFLGTGGSGWSRNGNRRGTS